MRQELQLLKDRNQHVRALEKSFNDTEAQREAISQDNDALQHEIKELYKQVEFGKALQVTGEAMQASIKDLSRQNEELQRLNQEHDMVMVWSDRCKETQGRTVA
ncbi:hypothetical protein VZT92_017342 [Zoarces viviparus]|uniref:Uncharacterized protein n=1 Tax=Zoarces viviparus TaxID=48416 RepID=A0AAW1ERS5_ZOAVI